MVDRAAPHIVGDLGRKLADDAGQAALRAIQLVGHPQDKAEILDIGMASLIALTMCAVQEAWPGFTAEQVGDAVVDSVRRLVDGVEVAAALREASHG